MQLGFFGDKLTDLQFVVLIISGAELSVEHPEGHGRNKKQLQWQVLYVYKYIFTLSFWHTE